MKYLFGFIGIFSLLYYFIIIGYAGIQATFSKIWLLIGGVCLFLMWMGIWAEKHGRSFADFLPNWGKIGLCLILGSGILCFIVVEGFIFYGMMNASSADLEYIVVLGAKVKGESPSKSLVKRMETAGAYLQENPDTIAILSGGKGKGEIITEAEAMRRYFVEKGFPEERLRIEDKSRDTKENIDNSFSLIGDKSASVGIVTNNFHVFRSVSIGKKMGCKNLEGIAAPSDRILQVNYLVREFFAVVKDKLIGNI